MLGLAGSGLLAIYGTAVAHVERTAYWPDPRPDASVHPAAGGKVPKARSLASALNGRLPGKTRVVCHKDSLSLAKASIRDARKHGQVARATG